jgi:two-component system, LuxR family, response regulator FixJ
MPSQIIYVVDDDLSVREALTTLFEAAGHNAKVYASAEEFLAKSGADPSSGCLLIDVRLPGMNGRDLQRAVNDAERPLAIVMMTGHGDIPMAVAAVKDGAMDFIEKPFDPATLLETVRHALARSEALHQDYSELVKLRERFAMLTAREQEVLALLAEGAPTKLIARHLNISPRTAETHRARVLEKMEARSLSALVKQVLLLQHRKH